MADFTSIEAQLNAQATELANLRQRVEDVADGRTRSTELLRIELSAYAKALKHERRRGTSEVCTRVMAAANALKFETKKSREEARTQMNAAVRGMSDLIRREHGQTRQTVRDEAAATRTHIDSWGQRLIQAIGGGDSPVAAILVSVLGLVLGIFIGIRSYGILSVLKESHNLWTEDGTPVIVNNAEVLVDELVFTPTQSKLISLLLAFSTFLCVNGIYFLIVHIVRSIRARH